MDGIQLGSDAFLTHDDGDENFSGPLAMSMVQAASVLRRVYCWAGFSVLVEAGSISVVANGVLRKFVFFRVVDLAGLLYAPSPNTSQCAAGSVIFRTKPTK
jgi:hypothetical protein